MKPMLSGKAPDDLSTLTYPVVVSPKLDGIRAIVHNGVVLSRKLKPIPNLYVQSMYGVDLLNGFDGEMIVGLANDPNVFHGTTSGIMSRDGQPDVTYHVFDDMTDPTMKFDHRLLMAQLRIIEDLSSFKNIKIQLVPHHDCCSPESVIHYENKYVGMGYEGIMIRALDGPYKFGRSTTKEGWLLKLKQWHDAEATLVDMVELMHNANELQTDELGYAKRSSHKEGKIGRDVMGTFVCQWKQPGFDQPIQFEIGTGFTAADREYYWQNKETFIGSHVTVKYQQITPDGVPRFPVFKGIRHADDMS